MERSPRLGLENFMIKILTIQYLIITHKAQARDKKTVRGAVNSMVTEDKLDIFMELLDHISDTTITNYIREIGKHKLPSNIDTSETEIYYLYGGKINEILFKKSCKVFRKKLSKC